MATQELNELQDEQTADIGASWVKGRMLRKDIDEQKMRVVVLVGGKVADDFYSEFTDDSENVTPLPAAHSLKGERMSEKSLVESGYRKGKTVLFNTMTRDIEVQ